MPDQDFFFPLPNDEYNKGVTLQEYAGSWFLVSSREGRDGKTYHDWCFPQDKDKKPREKALPWKIKIGSSREEAAKTIASIYHAIKPK